MRAVTWTARRAFAVAMVSLAAGCPDTGQSPDLAGGSLDSAAADQTVVADMTKPPDLAMPDLAVPDFAMPDFAMPDFAMPDFAMPDLAMPDFALPDLVVVPPRTQVDVLFMVDNSSGMSTMQQELFNRIPDFTLALANLTQQGTYLDLQIGVVTSDFGAGATGALPSCQPSPGGQLGTLQAIGAAAQAGCLAPVGANYIKYAFKPGGNDVSNLPAGQSLSQTLTCMASVGSAGCGFEHQLESVRAALNNNAANAGFVRPGALLVVAFLTNEDDCSASVNSDLFDRTLTALYGFEDSYRCTRFGLVSGSPPQLLPYGDSGGPLSMVAPAPNLNNAGPGRLWDVSRYTDFFTKPVAQGGVKADPRDVVLYAIAAPASPVQVILSNPGTPQSQSYAPCAPLNETSNPPCVPVLDHACISTLGSGDPAVRLLSVVGSAAHNGSSNICGNSYAPAVQDLVNLIRSAL